MDTTRNPDRKALEILATFSANASLARSLAGDLSHEESLLQLPFPANCLNWLVGHIINGRCTALILLNHESLWPQERRDLYKTGSSPMVAEDLAVRFEALLDDLDASQERLQESLLEATRDQLEELRVTDRGEKRVQDHLSGLAWHETFHIGQIDLLAAYARSSDR